MITTTTCLQFWIMFSTYMLLIVFNELLTLEYVILKQSKAARYKLSIVSLKITLQTIV